MNRISGILIAVMTFPVFSAMRVPEQAGFASGTGTVHSSVVNDPAVCDSLIAYASGFMNRPYCYGSRAPKCFDCSGFVQFVFRRFGTDLPNSSGNIALRGKFISFRNAKPADLIFFNGSSYNNETIGHVGIVTGCRGDTISFIHASVRAGVIISNTSEAYYSKRLLFVKRVELK